ncbi:hypothetical protein [Pseudobdellovibrio exovorus]|uniref:Uncharacterized protein n=1 Tax=Pseudobdellovibrio exovorus JSS TaxID=1184267 RepID=M4VCQ0_9BACT|nr:hypothetical protein [Pseudobdellovibrio exovorus]AGH96265.1 hypothetical protein A11Q_2049 [Pseudobdellovibrio exovorus JSS]
MKPLSRNKKSLSTRSSKLRPKKSASPTRYYPPAVIQNKQAQLLDGVDFNGKSVRALKVVVTLDRTKDAVKPPKQIKLHVESTESGTWKYYGPGNYYLYAKGKVCPSVAFGTHGTNAHVFFIPDASGAHSVQFIINLAEGSGSKEYVTSLSANWTPKQSIRLISDKNRPTARNGKRMSPPRKAIEAEQTFGKWQKSLTSQKKFSVPKIRSEDDLTRDPATIIGGIAALYPVVKDFLKDWFTGSTPVDMAPNTLYARVGDVIRIGLWDADDFCTILMNDKLCGGCGKGDQVQFLGDTVAKGANLILCKLSNQFPVQTGIDIWICRDGQKKWEMHFQVNEFSPLPSDRLILIQIWGS